MKGILALDQGTTASKAALYDLDGRLLEAGRAGVTTRFGPGGHAEQDPLEILATQERAIAQALAGRRESTLVAAGIATQRSTFVVWERLTGRPIAPAPTWQSRVGSDLCARLERRRRGDAGRVARLTGLPLSPHYSASKIAWLLDSVRGARRRAERGDLLFGTVATFLIWHLTEGRRHVIDPTQAARTLLFDIRTLEWHPSLLDLFGVPRAMLPDIAPSIGDLGTIRVSGRQVPLRACLGDQQAALIGAAGLATGASVSALVNYGTGAFVLIPTPGLRRSRGLLASLAWTGATQRRYILEGTVNPAGATLDWLRRELGAPAGLGGIDELCRRAAAGTLLLPAFWGMGSMWQTSGARPGSTPSLALNLALADTLAGLVRGGVETIAHMVREIIDRAGQTSGTKRLVATGTLTGLDHLMRFQAALLPQLQLRVCSEPDATLRGAALAAALSPDRWRGPRLAPPIATSARDRAEASARHRQWKRAVAMAQESLA